MFLLTDYPAFKLPVRREHVVPTMSDRKNISISEEANESIDPGVNFSELVDGWTREYFIEGNLYAVEKAMFEQLLEEVEDSRNQMHEQVDEMHDEIAAELQAKVDHLDEVGKNEKQQTGSDAQLEEAKESLKNTPRDPQNPAIKNWAKRLNMSPRELLDELPPKDGGGPELRSLS